MSPRRILHSNDKHGFETNVLKSFVFHEGTTYFVHLVNGSGFTVSGVKNLKITTSTSDGKLISYEFEFVKKGIHHQVFYLPVSHIVAIQEML